MKETTFETDDFVATVPDGWIGMVSVARSDGYPDAYQFHLSFEQGGGGGEVVIVTPTDDLLETNTSPSYVGQSSRGNHIWLADDAGKRLFKEGSTESTGLASITVK